MGDPLDYKGAERALSMEGEIEARIKAENRPRGKNDFTSFQSRERSILSMLLHEAAKKQDNTSIAGIGTSFRAALGELAKKEAVRQALEGVDVNDTLQEARKQLLEPKNQHTGTKRADLEQSTATPGLKYGEAIPT